MQIPTPEWLYLYNDLPACRAEAGADAARLGLLDELEAALRANPHVIVTDIEAQIEALACQGEHAPIPATLAIGGAGQRVASALHARTGWFPAISRLSITREELAPGRYAVVSTSGESIDAQLNAIASGRLAIVDDTVYSGLTLDAVLSRLPARTIASTEIFSLQAIAQTLARLRRICPVYTALPIDGRPDTEVSIVKGSHLFVPGAIRRFGGEDLAFYQRPEWMRAWFPANSATITAICARLAVWNRRIE